MPRPLAADELAFELAAVTDERREVATELVALARRAQMAVTPGSTAHRLLEEIERVARREHRRARAVA